MNAADGALTKAIVRPPGRNFADGLTTASLGSPDYHRALEQHAAYCVALEYCGLELIRLAADDDYPDSCFVEDAAIVFTDAQAQTRHAILTRPGALSRQGEIERMQRELSKFFPALDQIRSPGTLDGGDVCEAGTHYFIGISERTNTTGARQLADILNTRGLTTSFVALNTSKDDAQAMALLHLKSGIASVGHNRLVVTKALANRNEFRGYDLIRVTEGEEYAANCINVNGRVLIAAGFPVLEKRVRDLGYETIALDMSEFEKMDGGLSCLSLRW